MKAPLTKRELETLKLILAGLQNKEIAIQLGISVKTVEKFRALIYYKMEVSAPIPMLRVALRNKLITLKEFMDSSVGENAFHNNPTKHEHKTRNELAKV